MQARPRAWPQEPSRRERMAFDPGERPPADDARLGQGGSQQPYPVPRPLQVGSLREPAGQSLAFQALALRAPVDAAVDRVVDVGRAVEDVAVPNAGVGIGAALDYADRAPARRLPRSPPRLVRAPPLGLLPPLSGLGVGVDLDLKNPQFRGLGRHRRRLSARDGYSDTSQGANQPLIHHAIVRDVLGACSAPRYMLRFAAPSMGPLPSQVQVEVLAGMHRRA